MSRTAQRPKTTLRVKLLTIPTDSGGVGWSRRTPVLRKLGRSETRARRRGAALVEYVLLLSLFTLAAVPAIANLQNDEKTALRSTSAKIGGSPVPTDVAPELRETTTTTTLPPPPDHPRQHRAGRAPARRHHRAIRASTPASAPISLYDPEGDPIVSMSWYNGQRRHVAEPDS